MYPTSISLTNTNAQKPSDRTGLICWLEIPVKDVARAQKFYSDVFGWNTTLGEMASAAAGSSTIHFFTKGDSLHGAFHIMDEGCHLFNVDEADSKKLPLLTTLCVLNIEETLKKIEELGGKTHV